MKKSEVKLFAAVLAGGQSTRMGCETLIDRASRLAFDLIKKRPDRVVLSGTVPGRTCLPDSVGCLGPLGGVFTSIIHFNNVFNLEAAWLLILPVDMPLLPRQVLDRMISFALRAETEGYQCIAYEGFELPCMLLCQSKVLETIEILLSMRDQSQRSIHGLADRLKVMRLHLPAVEYVCMTNANTLNQWERIRQGNVL